MLPLLFLIWNPKKYFTSIPEGQSHHVYSLEINVDMVRATSILLSLTPYKDCIMKQVHEELVDINLVDKVNNLHGFKLPHMLDGS